MEPDGKSVFAGQVLAVCCKGVSPYCGFACWRFPAPSSKLLLCKTLAFMPMDLFRQLHIPVLKQQQMSMSQQLIRVLPSLKYGNLHAVTLSMLHKVCTPLDSRCIHRLLPHSVSCTCDNFQGKTARSTRRAASSADLTICSTPSRLPSQQH